jgi:hypothetical protein
MKSMDPYSSPCFYKCTCSRTRHSAMNTKISNLELSSDSSCLLVRQWWRWENSPGSQRRCHTAFDSKFNYLPMSISCTNEWSTETFYLVRLSFHVQFLSRYLTKNSYKHTFYWVSFNRFNICTGLLWKIQSYLFNLERTDIIFWPHLKGSWLYRLSEDDSIKPSLMCWNPRWT